MSFVSEFYRHPIVYAGRNVDGPCPKLIGIFLSSTARARFFDDFSGSVASFAGIRLFHHAEERLDTSADASMSSAIRTGAHAVFRLRSASSAIGADDSF